MDSRPFVGSPGRAEGGAPAPRGLRRWRFIARRGSRGDGRRSTGDGRAVGPAGGLEPAPDLYAVRLGLELRRRSYWSPDGQTLAYTADVEGVLQVFVKRVGDATSRQSPRADSTRTTRSGTMTAGESSSPVLPANTNRLWAVGIAGGRPDLILPNVTGAAIDPDGSRLALLRVAPGRRNAPGVVVVVASRRRTSARNARAIRSAQDGRG